jgi:hypothetical protein
MSLREQDRNDDVFEYLQHAAKEMDTDPNQSQLQVLILSVPQADKWHEVVLMAAHAAGGFNLVKSEYEQALECLRQKRAQETDNDQIFSPI